jgi:hypothetical protein
MVTMELTELAGLMATVANSLRLPIKVEEDLELVTRSVKEAISGVTHASISLTTKDGAVETLAPTDAIAASADQLQYELREGPCLAAALTEPMVRVDDLATDARWPSYGPKAAELGLRSQLSFQFRAEPHARGALNLYADRPDVFDDDAHHVAVMFADWTAVLLGWSKQEASLAEALGSRTMIGTAIGIVMERYHIDQDRAFAFLVRTSQTANAKLRAIAADVVADARSRAEQDNR